MNQYHYDFFISYHREDEKHAKELYERLHHKNYKVFLDISDIDSSLHIIPQFGSALQKTKILVQIIAKDRQASNWAEFERSVILDADPLNESKRFYVLKLDEDAALPDYYFLKDEFYLPWHQDDLSQTIAQIEAVYSNQPPRKAPKLAKIVSPDNDDYWYAIDESRLISKFAFTNSLLLDFYIDSQLPIPDYLQDNGAKKGQPPSFVGNDQPAICINWFDGLNICKWFEAKLKRHGVIGDNDTITLPSSDDYKKVANIDSGNYPWGTTRLNEFYANFGWHVECTREVNCYPNADRSNTGVHCLFGNVWEWCSDSTKEESAPIFGGSWGSKREYLRLDNCIQSLSKEVRDQFTGLRLLKVLG